MSRILAVSLLALTGYLGRHRLKEEWWLLLLERGIGPRREAAIRRLAGIGSRRAHCPCFHSILWI